MAPAGIVLNSEAESIVLNRIHNAYFWRLKGFKVGRCDGFAANQIV